MALFGVAIPQTANAATFSVNSSLDAGDAAAGDGVCATAGAVCTLRAAIEEANALSGTDTINFAIAGAGPHTISPATALPAISEAITIDASTQTGASCGDLVPASLPAESNTPHDLRIELSGANIPDNYGLTVDGANAETGTVTVRGFVVNGFADNGAAFLHWDQGSDDSLGLTVDCSYLGTNVAGSAADSNERNINHVSGEDVIVVTNSLVSGAQTNAASIQGAQFNMSGSLVGTDDTGTNAIPNASDNDDTGSIFANTSTLFEISNNIIAGNNSYGIQTEMSNNQIEDNYIGLNLAGEPLANDLGGVSIAGTNNPFTISGNVISANNGDGLRLYSDCAVDDYNGIDGGVIESNYIGTDTTAAVADGYGNARNGIRVYEYSGFCATISDIIIGGIDSTTTQNVIAGNTENGILLYQTPDTDVRDVAILINSIHSNGGLGIDLAMDNDDDGTAETNLGPNSIGNTQIKSVADETNYFLNYATINSISRSGNNLTVNYDLNANESDGSVDVVGYRLDFYLNDAADDSGYGEGKTHLGTFIVSGSVDDASHTFVSPVELSDSMYVSTTTTMLKEPAGGGE